MNGFIRLRSVALKMNAKRWSCGVLSGWLLTTACADAQIIHWSHGINTSVAVVSQTSSSGSRREADELLRQAREAMKANDIGQAKECLERIEKMGVRYEGLVSRFSDSPAKLRRDLAKLDPSIAAELAKPSADAVPSGPSSFPDQEGQAAQPLAATPAAGATSDADTAARKAQTMQLMAGAQAALNRGDVARAEQLANQARSLGVPDSAFAAGETRPWMLLLQIDRAGS